MESAGPKSGPLRQRCWRELEPDIEEQFQPEVLEWWVDVKRAHDRDIREYVHNPNMCRWCDAIGNLGEVEPDMEHPLRRYIAARIHEVTGDR